MTNTALETTTNESTALEPRSLAWYLEQTNYKARFESMLKERAPQFISSIISLGSGANFKGVEPRSVIAAAAVAASLDLPINPSLGFAWIIPYGGRAQFQMGFRSYIQLAQRTAQYSRMNAKPINKAAYKGYDDFGEAVIDWSKLDETKEAVGYVFAFELINGFRKIEYWPKEKMVAHAERYSQNHKGHIERGRKKSKDCRWCSDFLAMALKTVTSNTLRKWGILSTEMQFALTRDQTSAIDVDADVIYSDRVDEEEIAAEEDVEKIDEERRRAILELAGEVECPTDTLVKIYTKLGYRGTFDIPISKYDEILDAVRNWKDLDETEETVEGGAAANGAPTDDENDEPDPKLVETRKQQRERLEMLRAELLDLDATSTAIAERLKSETGATTISKIEDSKLANAIASFEKWKAELVGERKKKR